MTAPFLWDTAGTGGLVGSAPVTLLSTELNSLASGSAATSSVGGSSGVFTASNTNAAIWCYGQLVLGAIGSALTAGGCASGWFLLSLDNGSTFDAAPNNTIGPDFTVPLPATTISAGQRWPTYRPFLLPSVPFQVYLMNNNTGQSFASSGNSFIVGPIAPAY